MFSPLRTVGKKALGEERFVASPKGSIPLMGVVRGGCSLPARPGVSCAPSAGGTRLAEHVQTRRCWPCLSGERLHTVSLVLVVDAVEILECVTPSHLFSSPMGACVRLSMCVSRERVCLPRACWLTR